MHSGIHGVKRKRKSDTIGEKTTSCWSSLLPEVYGCGAATENMTRDSPLRVLMQFIPPIFSSIYNQASCLVPLFSQTRTMEPIIFLNCPIICLYPKRKPFILANVSATCSYTTVDAKAMRCKVKRNALPTFLMVRCAFSACLIVLLLFCWSLP